MGADTPGEPIGEVELDIDYKILEHFSRHLYGSPNKAIEELVSNSFDAWARNVYVYVPGRFSPDHVIVWDDGTSMDLQGLKDLWVIAWSPKEREGRVARGPHGERDVIGKFGIGKIASYSVGDSMTHLCRRNKEFLLVTVDYRTVQSDLATDVDKRERVNDPTQAATTRTLTATRGAPKEARANQTAREKRRSYKTPVRRLTEVQARQFVRAHFAEYPSNADKMFNGQEWTFAIVGHLKTVDLQSGRLGWIIGNGMPLRPDFRVWLNDEELTTKLEKQASHTWDFGTKEIQSSLRVAWKDAVKEGDVAGAISFSKERSLNHADRARAIPFAEVSELGRVWGQIRLFKTSLLDGPSAAIGRSYGFFVYVRDRLINAADEKLLLPDPSFGTFYRSQFVIHADGLDAELLADRERLRVDTPTAKALAVVQRALYLAARSKLASLDEGSDSDSPSLSLLPTGSREFFREPLTSLVLTLERGAVVGFDASNPDIQRKPLGDDGRIAQLGTSGFEVNTSHPYYQVLEKRLGSSKKAEEVLRIYDVFAISDRLLEGFLYDMGMSKDDIANVFAWREGLFRALATAHSTALSDPAMVLVNTSYRGDKVFETAIEHVLNAMGFNARRDGRSGKKDVLVAAPIGDESFKFTFEGKGSKNAVANDAAELAGAANHRDEVGAEHAVVVAREFSGFASSRGEPAILKECRSVGRVSIVTVEALNTLLEIVETYALPLSALKPALCEVESPKAKLERIHALADPTVGFRYRQLLEELWRRQGDEGYGELVPYRSLWQAKKRGWGAESFEEFEEKLIALETLAGGLMLLRKQQREVCIRQAPGVVIRRIRSSLSDREQREK
jgi:hypothetical protein